MKVAWSCLALYGPMDCTWNSPGQNTGVGRLALLQGIFPTQRSNPGLPHCRQILYQLSLELTPRKYVIFIIWEWNARVGSQQTPGVTGTFGLGVQNEVGQRLIEFFQQNALVIANTLFQQTKRRLYTWTSPDGQHWSQIDYILCSQRWRSSIESAKQDQELSVAQIMNSLLANSDLNWEK